MGTASAATLTPPKTGSNRTRPFLCYATNPYKTSYICFIWTLLARAQARAFSCLIPCTRAPLFALSRAPFIKVLRPDTCLCQASRASTSARANESLSPPSSPKVRVTSCPLTVVDTAELTLSVRQAIKYTSAELFDIASKPSKSNFYTRAIQCPNCDALA